MPFPDHPYELFLSRQLHPSLHVTLFFFFLVNLDTNICQNQLKSAFNFFRIFALTLVNFGILVMREGWREAWARQTVILSQSQLDQFPGRHYRWVRTEYSARHHLLEGYRSVNNEIALSKCWEGTNESCEDKRTGRVWMSVMKTMKTWVSVAGTWRTSVSVARQGGVR